MAQETGKPSLSQQGREAFDAFQGLPFTGNGQADEMRASVALCAMYGMEYAAEGRYVANTSMEGYRNTAQQVRTFVDATQELLQFMDNPRPAHFELSKMGSAIGRQDEAKHYARGLIEALRAEVQRDFPGEYRQAMDALGGADQQMWRL